MRRAPRPDDRTAAGGPMHQTARRAVTMTSQRALALVAVIAICGPALSAAADWPLHAYEDCGVQSLGLAPPATGAGVDMSYDVDANVLWVASGLSLYRTSYPSGDILASKVHGSSGELSVLAVESVSNARKDLENLTFSIEPRTLSVAHIDNGKAAVVDGSSPMVSIVDGDLNMVSAIFLEVIPYSITYDAAYEVFYATLSTDRNTVVQFDFDGKHRVLFTGEDIAEVITSDISDIYYAGNLGNLMLLCEGCETITEVSLAGAVRNNEIKVTDVQAVAFSRTGSPMLQLSSASMEVTQLCQSIPIPTPVLPPLSAALPPPQSWFPLDTYAFCGQRVLDAGEGAVLQDFAVGPLTRTLWAVVDGDLVEYSLGGDVLRVQTKEMLSAIGIDGLTAVAWKERFTFLLGSKEGNMVAAVDTVPKSVVDMVPVIYSVKTGLTGDDLEPPGPEEEMDIVRQVNQLEVISSASVGGDLIAPDSLDAITYHSAAGTVLVSSAGSTSVIWSALDGSEADVLMTGAVLGETTSEISNLLYNPTKDDVLTWCEDCASLTEVMASPEVFLSDRKFAPYETNDAEDRSSSYTITPEGALLMIGSHKGEVSYYCSNGEPIGQSPLVTVVRENSEPDVGPEYWWNLQTTTGNSAASLPAVPGGVRTADAELLFDGYDYQTATSCSNPTMGPALANKWRYQCELACQFSAACGAFTYIPGTKTCLLKGSCSEAVAMAGRLSGVKRYAPEAPSPAVSPASPAVPYSYLELKECQEPSLVIIQDTTQEACEQYCSATAACAAFTFNSNTAKCYPKAACADPKDHSVDFTGIKVSPPTPAPTKPPVGFTVLEDVGCQAPTVDSFNGLNAQQCQNRCQWSWHCKAFTLDSAGRCFLKKACDAQTSDEGSLSGLKFFGSAPTMAPTPDPEDDSSEEESSSESEEESSSELEEESSVGSPPPNDDDDDFVPPPVPTSPALYGGWEYTGQSCTPWDTPDNDCGMSGNPGLKVGDITWYRMFAHKANPLLDLGDGVVEWTPFRERRTWGEMYWKGSEILGYFDEPMSAKNVGDTVSVAFAWNSVGKTECKSGNGGLTEKECEQCEEDWDGSSKYIYHEVRCYSGTGDFRVALVDSTKGNHVEKDGYGYWSDKVSKYRGLQWRFHPHACPTEPRAKPGGYAATAAGSWIRSNIQLDEMNSKGLVNDFVEGSKLGDRSFKERMFDPADDGACINLPVGEWTPEDDPFRMTLNVRERKGGKVRFEWRMDFNGWSAEKTEEWDEDVFPDTIDTVVIGYTNSRSFTSLKLKRV